MTSNDFRFYLGIINQIDATLNFNIIVKESYDRKQFEKIQLKVI